MTRVRAPLPVPLGLRAGRPAMLLLGCGAVAVVIALGAILTGSVTDFGGVVALVAVIAAKIAMLPLIVWVLLWGAE